MADTVVVGDGPTGLQAALLLAKNGVDVKVYGQDETYMHDAYLYNYLGIEEIHGSDMVEVARDQVEEFGADIVEDKVERVERDAEGFRVEASGEVEEAERVVLAEGDSPEVAEELGVEFEDGNVKADKYGNTSMEGVYAGGWCARDNRIQAAISVGDGAAIALTILSEEKGTEFHDFDVPG